MLDIKLILDNNSVLPMYHLLRYYSESQADTQSLGYDYKPHISFAWENPDLNNSFWKYLNDTVSDAEIIVVIGYSFPFFNRDIDRHILSKMENIRKIYIQDKVPNRIEQSISAVLQYKPPLIPIEDCNQFFLPGEL